MFSVHSLDGVAWYIYALSPGVITLCNVCAWNAVCLFFAIGCTILDTPLVFAYTSPVYTVLRSSLSGLSRCLVQPQIYAFNNTVAQKWQPFSKAAHTPHPQGNTTTTLHQHHTWTLLKSVVLVWCSCVVVVASLWCELLWRKVVTCGPLYNKTFSPHAACPSGLR